MTACLQTANTSANAPCIPATLPNRLRYWWHLWQQRRIDRDAFKTLERLDDGMLQDIGVTRADVTWASQLPLSHNASVELELIARGHNKNQAPY